MNAYISKQLRLIHLYAEQLNVDDESATKLWVENGLAARYNKMYCWLYNL